MTDEELDPRARAGETKRRRTREKLMNAADYAMRESGVSATVEEIAEEAGVSTATFYTFYHSRNEVCLDAFTELVLAPLETLGMPDKPFKESAEALLKQCEGRSALVRAALTARLDNAPNYERSFVDELVKRVADLLSPHLASTDYSLSEAFEGKANAHEAILNLAALWLLDALAMNLQPNVIELNMLVRMTLPATTA